MILGEFLSKFCGHFQNLSQKDKNRSKRTFEHKEIKNNSILSKIQIPKFKQSVGK